MSHHKSPQAPGCGSRWSSCCFCSPQLEQALVLSSIFHLSSLGTPSWGHDGREMLAHGEMACVAQPQLRGHQPPLMLSHLTSPNALWGRDEEQSSHPPMNPSLPPPIHPTPIPRLEHPKQPMKTQLNTCELDLGQATLWNARHGTNKPC